jgi:hypothetical protein
VGYTDRAIVGPILVKRKENEVGCSKDFGPKAKKVVETFSDFKTRI